MMAKIAHTMTCSVCDCGCGIVELAMLDKSGNVLVIAQIPPASALALVDQIVCSILVDDDDEDTIGQVEGHA
jgi:hypothetical protein